MARWKNNEDAGDLRAMAAADASEARQEEREASGKAAAEAGAEHIFEHLGPFPYKVVSLDCPTSDFRRTVDAQGFTHETKVGGTCDHCGRAIVNKVHFEAADGTKFHVGVDCAEKAGFEGFQKRVREAAKARKQNREKSRVHDALAALHDNWELFASEPHPTKWGAQKGLTRADYFDWMLNNAGRAKKLSVSKEIEKLVSSK